MCTGRLLIVDCWRYQGQFISSGCVRCVSLISFYVHFVQFVNEKHAINNEAIDWLINYYCDGQGTDEMIKRSNDDIILSCTMQMCIKSSSKHQHWWLFSFLYYVFLSVSCLLSAAFINIFGWHCQNCRPIISIIIKRFTWSEVFSI